MSEPVIEAGLSPDPVALPEATANAVEAVLADAAPWSVKTQSQVTSLTVNGLLLTVPEARALWSALGSELDRVDSLGA